MLERASSSAECTAQLFLKRFELPTRSRRSLGPAFWRHGGDDLNVPAWWPLYLDHVRKKTQVYSVFPDPSAIHTQNSVGLPDRKNGKARAIRSSGQRQFTNTIHKSRSYTQSVTRTQEASLLQRRNSASEDRHGDDLAERQDDDEQMRNRGPHDGARRYSEFSDHKSEDHTQQIPTPLALTADGEPDYHKAWSIFVQGGYRREMASRVLHFMASSNVRADLMRALKAFDSIARRGRSLEDYETATQLAIQLHNYKFAISIIHEAASVGLGANIYFKFMAYCVQHTLWNTLAIFWASMGQVGRDVVASVRRNNDRRRTSNFAGRFAFHFENVDDLPDKITKLADRLQSSDPVVAVHKNTLIDVCKRLVYLTMESRKIMSAISGKGVLAMFQVQDQLNFESKLHLVALGTIGRMADKGAKNQLAMLIYRNLRFTKPGHQVPSWVYGTLLGICSEARLHPTTYKLLLDEFSKMHGKPDDWAYRQVIKACAAQGEAQALLSIFLEFKNSGGRIDLHDLNSLVHVYAVVGDADNAQAQFDRIAAEYDLLPDVISWTSLILAHARSSHSETSFKVYEEMKQASILPNHVTWSILMNVASQRGDLQHAQQLYETARRERIPGSIYMVGALVEAFLKNSDPLHAESLVVRASRVMADESPIRLWNSLFRYYAFKADSKAILRLQRLMKRYDVKADEMTYAALMTALVVQGKTADATKVLRTLHFSQGLNPTAFHYSILIHGFAQEGERDMATTIYNEMLERFPQATPSAKLAMLHLQLRKDDDAVKSISKSRLQRSTRSSQMSTKHELTNTMDYLAEALIRDSPNDIASKLPNPGFGRRTLRDGLDSIYLQSITQFLQSRAAFDYSENFIVASKRLRTQSTSPTMLIQDLALEMNVAIREQQWHKVDSLWTQVLAHGQILGRSSTLGNQPSHTVTSHVQEATAPLPEGLESLSGEESSFKPMVPSQTIGQAEKDRQTSILFAQRFMLSRPFSTYMQALDYQQRHHDIVITVEKFQSLGFQLSSRNWNRYIQVMSKSADPQHRLLAFKTFEEIMLPNTPSWKLMRRGKWISLDTEYLHDDGMMAPLKSRYKAEKMEPDFPLPSYFTMIHLATALMRAYQAVSNNDNDNDEVEVLHRQAPGTFMKVQRTPHIRDRIQGFLLRGREIIGDRESRPRRSASVRDVSGIRGSKSPLDNLPVELLQQFELVLAPRESIRGLLQGRHTVSQQDFIDERLKPAARFEQYVARAERDTGALVREPVYLSPLNRFETEREVKKRVRQESLAKLEPMVFLAEQMSGEIIRRPVFLEAQGRFETTQELRKRIRSETIQKLDLLERARKDSQSNRLLTNSRTGDPPLDPAHSPTGAATERQVYPKNMVLEALLHPDKLQLAEVLSLAREQAQSEKATVEYGSEPFNSDISAAQNHLSHGQQSSERDVAAFQPLNHLSSQFYPEPILREKKTGLVSISAGTKLLTRRITPSYIKRGMRPSRKRSEIFSRVKKAWTINKSTRLRRLRETQTEAQWRRKIASKREQEADDTTEIGEDSNTRLGKGGQEYEEHSDRAARLAMSRGARKFG